MSPSHRRPCASVTEAIEKPSRRHTRGTRLPKIIRPNIIQPLWLAGKSFLTFCLHPPTNRCGPQHWCVAYASASLENTSCLCCPLDENPVAVCLEFVSGRHEKCVTSRVVRYYLCIAQMSYLCVYTSADEVRTKKRKLLAKIAIQTGITTQSFACCCCGERWNYRKTRQFK